MNPKRHNRPAIRSGIASPKLHPEWLSKSLDVNFLFQLIGAQNSGKAAADQPTIPGRPGKLTSAVYTVHCTLCTVHPLPPVKLCTLSTLPYSPHVHRVHPLSAPDLATEILSPYDDGIQGNPVGLLQVRSRSRFVKKTIFYIVYSVLDTCHCTLKYTSAQYTQHRQVQYCVI